MNSHSEDSPSINVLAFNRTDSGKSATKSPQFAENNSMEPRGNLSMDRLLAGAPPSPSSSNSLPSPKDTKDIEDVYGALDEESFIETHIAQLARQVAEVMSDTVHQNDQSPFTTDKLTRFHSRASPGISIHDYLLRIIKFCNLDKSVLLVLLYFVDLFSESYARFVLNSLTVHRFLITAAAVASKGLCDLFCTNTHYAKVGGITVMELNLLEVEFLTRVSYRIIPPQHVLPKYYHMIKVKGESISASEESNSESQSQIEINYPPNTSKFGANNSKQSTGTTSSSHNATAGSNANSTATSASSKSTRKHGREDLQKVLSAESISGRSLKAMKDSFKFFHSSKKKKAESQ